MPQTNPQCQTCQWYQTGKSQCWLEPPKVIRNPATVDPNQLTWVRTKVSDPTEHCSYWKEKK